MARDEIDNDVLINEIENRPPLYNRDLKEYNDLSLRKHLWEEVTAQCFADSWTRMNVDKREKTVNDVQKRWKNLRACFSRELRLQRSSSESTKRRQYIYFNRLLFLTQSLDQSEMACRNEEEDDTDDYRIDEEFIKEEPHTPISRKRKHFEPPFLEISAPQREENLNNYSLTEVPVDPDINFALSLVPMLKVLPMDRKLDAQIEILKTLRKCIGGDVSASRSHRSNDPLD